MSTSDGSKPSEHETLWTPGQYVALDFSEELYMGYTHMNDGSPSSLNDDYIRTFTVSKSHVPGVDEFEVTVRNVGTITRWLSWQNTRSAINIEVKGFAGDFAISTNERSVFVAAGIGITPFLGASKDNLDHCTVLWTLAVADVGLALDVVGELSAQARKRLIIFVTGVYKEDSSSEHLQILEDLQAQVKVNRRRLTKLDLTELDAEGESIKWYLCMTPAMRKQVQEWLEHRTMIFENFDY